jgi:putative transposase
MIGIKPILINGRIIKSINQYYNKKVASLKEKLPKGIFTSKKIQFLSRKRKNKINDYFHKASAYILHYLINNDVSKIVIGHNTSWKQNIKLGRRNNQNFVYIPYNSLIEMLKYKCELNGIEVVIREEAYTSKCSFLDIEDIGKQEKYQGTRTKRGLFISANGKEINADINGALNILRKEIKNQFFNWDLIEDYSIAPIKVVMRR